MACFLVGFVGTDGSGLFHVELVPVLHLPHVLILLLQTLLQLIDLLGHWGERERERESERENCGEGIRNEGTSE